MKLTITIDLLLTDWLGIAQIGLGVSEPSLPRRREIGIHLTLTKKIVTPLKGFNIY